MSFVDVLAARQWTQEVYMAYLFERVHPNAPERYHFWVMYRELRLTLWTLPRADGKISDWAILIPWALVWNVTVLDTFDKSHISDTSSLAGAAVNHAATLKTYKYISLTDINIFFPIAVKTGGAWDQQDREFIQEFQKRISVVTKEARDNISL